MLQPDPLRSHCQSRRTMCSSLCARSMRKDTPACPWYPVRQVESTHRVEPQPLHPGCEFMSPRYQSFEMGLPPFRGAVRQLILFSTAVYIALLLMMAFASALAQTAFAFGVLQPEKVLHGWVWQLGTYAFMYADPIAFILSLVGIYFIGSAVEGQIGASRFYGLFFGSLTFSGAVGVALSLSGVIAQGSAIGSGSAPDTCGTRSFSVEDSLWDSVSVSTACATRITVGSGVARRRSFRSTCVSTTATSTSTNTATTSRRMTS